MQPTGQPAEDQRWQPLLEADPADAQEQAREVMDAEPDPEDVAAVDLRGLDLGTASEADLAEQLVEVPFDDDDGER